MLKESRAQAAGLVAGDQVVGDQRPSGDGRPDLGQDLRVARPSGDAHRAPEGQPDHRCAASGRSWTRPTTATASASGSPASRSVSALRIWQSLKTTGTVSRETASRARRALPLQGQEALLEQRRDRPATAPRRCTTAGRRTSRSSRFISLSLALFNLLPLLPLDGGHIAFSLARGHPRPRDRARGLRARLGRRHHPLPAAFLHRPLERRRPARRRLRVTATPSRPCNTLLQGSLRGGG